jgi:hypothetical protein
VNKARTYFERRQNEIEQAIKEANKTSADYQARYNLSPKGRARTARYLESKKGQIAELRRRHRRSRSSQQKEAWALHNKSKAGQIAKLRYSHSAKGKEAKAKWHLRDKWRKKRRVPAETLYILAHLA